MPPNSVKTCYMSSVLGVATLGIPLLVLTHCPGLAETTSMYFNTGCPTLTGCLTGNII